MFTKLARFAVLVSCFVFFGCNFGGDFVRFCKPDKSPNYVQLYEGYSQIKLMEDGSAEVLAVFGEPIYVSSDEEAEQVDEKALLSQSESVIASSGLAKKGYKSWLRMVGFDENELTARRKYIFMADERPKTLFTEPWESASFDCEMVLGEEVLGEPYANENARRIGRRIIFC